MTDNEKKSFFTEGIFIFLAPIIAYIITYLYELGFANVFLIPERIIKLNITNIFLVSGILVGFFGLFFWIVEFISFFIIPINLEKNIVIYKAIAKTVIPMIFVISLIIIYGFKLWKEWISWLYLLGIFIFLEFIYPLITQWSKKGYIEKMKGQDELDAKSTPLSNSFVNFAIKYPFKYFLVIFLLFLSFFVSYNYGRATALKNENYLIANLPSKKGLVVLNIYDDYALCASLNPKTGRVQKNFIITEIKNKDIEFQLKKIGPLKMEK